MTSLLSTLYVSVLQQFTALYTFVVYFEHTSFMYDNPSDVEFYGSFYCAVLGSAANLLGACILFFDDDITKPVPSGLKFHPYTSSTGLKPAQGSKFPSSRYAASNGRLPTGAYASGLYRPNTSPTTTQPRKANNSPFAGLFSPPGKPVCFTSFPDILLLQTFLHY